MEGSLRVVPVFLGMSSELESDRQELGNFFAGLNDIVAGHGVYFRLVRWQQGLPDCLSREASSVLEGCELAAFLFFTTVDGEVEGAFDAALAAFREKGSPEIVTWFHVVPEGKSVASELEAFRARLKGELHHYYNTYDRIDTVELRLMLQLARGTLGGGAVDIGEEGALTIATDELCLWGKPVMGLSGVPAYQGWTAIAQAQSQLAAIEADYQEARARCLEDPNDASAEEAYGDLLLERRARRAELERAQRDFLKTMQEMARRTSGAQPMTERQRQAYRLLEVGRAEEALALLDREEIADDVSAVEEQLAAIEAVAEAAREREQARLGALVQELLQRADLLGSRPMTPEALAELESTLRQAADVEARHDLGSTARVRLARHLLEHDRFSEASSVLDELEPFLASVEWSEGDDRVVFELAHARQMQSALALSRRDFDAALSAIDWAMGLASGESAQRKLLRASLLDQFAHVLTESGASGTSALKVAEDALDRAYALCLSIGEEAGGGLLAKAGAVMAGVLNRKAEICLKTGRLRQAEETLSSVVSALKDAPAGDHRAINDLATSYIELADARHQRGELEGELAYARKAMEALSRADAQNPGRYLNTQAMAAGKAGTALLGLGRPEEAVSLLSAATDCLRTLCEQGGMGMYGGLFCGMMDDLARAYDSLGRPELALRCCEEALSVSREIARLDPGRYRETPVVWLSNIAGRVAREDPLEAIRLYEQAMDVVRGLGQPQDARGADILAGLLSSAGELGLQLGDFEYAHDRLAAAASLLGRAYDEVGDASLLQARALALLNDRYALICLGRSGEAEDAARKSVELARKVARHLEESGARAPHRALLALCLYRSALLHAKLGRFAEACSESAEIVGIAQDEGLLSTVDLVDVVAHYSVCLSEVPGDMARAVRAYERAVELEHASVLKKNDKEPCPLSDYLFMTALDMARMTEGGKVDPPSLVARNWWFVARQMLLNGEEQSAETALSRALGILRSLGRERDARDCQDDINETLAQRRAR